MIFKNQLIFSRVTFLVMSVLLMSFTVFASSEWPEEEVWGREMAHMARLGIGRGGGYMVTPGRGEAAPWTDHAHTRLAALMPASYVDPTLLDGDFDQRFEGIRVSRTGNVLRIGTREYECSADPSPLTSVILGCLNFREYLPHHLPLTSFLDRKIYEINAKRRKEALSFQEDTIEGIRIIASPGRVTIGSRLYAVCQGNVLMEYEKDSPSGRVIHEDLLSFMLNKTGVRAPTVTHVYDARYDARVVIEKMMRAGRTTPSRDSVRKVRTTRHIEAKREAAERRRGAIERKKEAMLREKEKRKERFDRERRKKAERLGIKGAEVLSQETLQEAIREEEAKREAERLGIKGTKSLTREQLESKIKEKQEEARERARKRRAAEDARWIYPAGGGTPYRKVSTTEFLVEKRIWEANKEAHRRGAYVSYKDNLKARNAYDTLASYGFIKPEYKEKEEMPR